VSSTSWSARSENHYQTASGSSAAVPHVSGVIAQLLAAGYDQRGAVARVLETATNGQLDAAAALGVPVASPAITAPTPAPPAAAVTPTPPPTAPASTPTPSRAVQSIRLADALEPATPISASPAPPRP
jgi:subtilisin family serine protease